LTDDGKAGIQSVLVQLSDVAIVDTGLPGLTGDEVTRRLRADGK
jgi:CheY-like chemotaxis protein